MLRWLKIGALILLLAVTAFFWMAHREAQMIREDVRQTQAALASITSFHSRYEGPNFLAGEPPLTQDVWVVCPDFRHEITRVEGAPERDEIRYRGTAYAKVEDRWAKLPGSPLQTQGCGTLAGDYGLGVPAGFDLMLAGGTILVNNTPRTVSGVPCYDYTVTIPTADVARHKLVQTLCLNSDDHLPRQVIVHGMGADAASVRTTTYDQWNRIPQPDFPEGFVPVGD